MIIYYLLKSHLSILKIAFLQLFLLHICITCGIIISRKGGVENVGNW
nr:MAG TPA: hypothetical protein [Caudoviricetes sp.]